MTIFPHLYHRKLAREIVIAQINHSKVDKPSNGAYAAGLHFTRPNHGKSHHLHSSLSKPSPSRSNASVALVSLLRLDNATSCLSSILEICESLTPGPCHAIDITREAIREGADAVIAVGGDGTLHEVVNGLFWAGKPVTSNVEEPSHSTALVLIPLGTGSDFAQTFGWKNDSYEAIERISKGVRSKIDVGVITGETGEEHYFINVADIHLSAKAGLYASKYKKFGKLCYVIGKR
ncbi:hypothetical protein K1719_016875 [Acacia pycnantha]|nr:hypothetical protein K1719_016875 [Acacia pycnantha]